MARYKRNDLILTKTCLAARRFRHLACTSLPQPKSIYFQTNSGNRKKGGEGADGGTTSDSPSVPIVEEPTSTVVPSTSAPADSSGDSAGPPNSLSEASTGAAVADGVEPRGSLLEEADAMVARVMEVDEAEGAGAEDAAEVKVSADIPKHERAEYVPVLCECVTARYIKRRHYPEGDDKLRVIREGLGGYNWKYDLEEIEREIVRVGPTFALAEDEIPLSGYLEDPSVELSMCPYCFRTLVPGRGLHFIAEVCLDESSYSPDAPDADMRWIWKPHWIRNRREPADVRENRRYLRHVRRTVGRVVRSYGEKANFPKIWVDEQRAVVLAELPRQYT